MQLKSKPMIGKFITLIVCIAFSLGLVNCKPENNCFSIENGVVYSVSGPDNGIVNTPITITANFYAVNGCGSFHSISDVKENFTVTIEVKVAYNGCVCADMIMDFSEDFVFQTSNPGVYTFVFKNVILEDIVHTITIN
jgi:hypothetical protein